MIEAPFTEVEAQALEQLTAIFYYPEPNRSPYERVRQIAGSLERHEDVISASLNTVEYEQSERYRYVASALYGSGSAVGLADAETLTRSLALATQSGQTPDLGKLAQDLGLAIPSQSLNPTIVEQAQIADSVQRQVDKYYAELASRGQTGSIYDLLKSLPEADLKTLNEGADALISYVNSNTETILQQNISIPQNVTEVLKKVGAAFIIERSESLQSKIAAVTELKAIASAILANRQQATPVADEIVKESLGLWLRARKTLSS